MCVCRKDYYSTNSSAEAVVCAKCPSGTDCTTDSTDTLTLQQTILPGYYRLTNRSATWSKCPLGSAPARHLHLLRARLAAPGTSTLPR